VIYTQKAAGKVLTLGELRAFVAACDQLTVSDSAKIKGHAGLRGVYEVAVDASSDPAPLRAL
jgi:hypothetical protein